jgi:hypothetical protein
LGMSLLAPQARAETSHAASTCLHLSYTVSTT